MKRRLGKRKKKKEARHGHQFPSSKFDSARKGVGSQTKEELLEEEIFRQHSLFKVPETTLSGCPVSGKCPRKTHGSNVTDLSLVPLWYKYNRKVTDISPEEHMVLRFPQCY